MGWGPSAPDMSGANELAREQASIGREAWQDYRTNFAPVILDQMQQQIDIGRGTYDLARENQSFQMGLARKYDQRFWNTQVPLEDRIIRESNSFDTEGERERLAGLAVGDVRQSFGRAREQGLRELNRRGVDPSDGSFRSVLKDLTRDEALAAASAATKTREAARQLGWSRRLDAAALGRGLPGFSSDSSRVAQGWSSEGRAGAGMGLQAAGYGAGVGANAATTSGNLYGQASQNLRLNAIESAKSPGFDAVMGLVSGGMRAAGAYYGGR